ncbi:hypothetical protein ACWCRF_14260 [Streptomyces sp. NPDC002405]
MGVFLGHASSRGRVLTDRELYLPDESWVRDTRRRRDAATPKEVGFASEPELGRRMPTGRGTGRTGCGLRAPVVGAAFHR